MSDATWTPRTERERDAVESVAKIIHAAMREVQPPNATKAWVDGGNAIAQDVARYAAKNILAMFKKPVPAPPTRLREVKVGAWTYRYNNYVLETKCRADGGWARVYHVETSLLPALADLIARPTEPAPDAVVEALVAFYHDKGGEIEEPIQSAAERTATTVRALVRAETEAQPLTVAEHVAALERKKATKHRVEFARVISNSAYVKPGEDILILPPEAP
jgi:hypothetical protein